MKRLPVVILLSLFAACSNQPRNVSSIDSTTGDVYAITKSLSSSDELIDLPFWKTLTEKGSSGLSAEEIAKAKAAVYRFYQHVSIRNGYYSCDLSSASEIHVSEEVFNDLMNNLEEINRLVKERRDKGMEIELPDVTEDYLNSLLE